MNYELINRIKDTILECHPELKDARPIVDDTALLEEITYDLDKVISFTFEVVESHCEFTIQCHYVSKINRTVIFDHDVTKHYHNVDDLAETLADFEQRILWLESTIMLK